MVSFRSWFCTLVIAFLAGLLWLFPQQASCTPEFAAREAANCTDACHSYLGDLPQMSSTTRCATSCGGCHVSPTGSGIRNDCGFNYQKKNLHLTSSETLEQLNPKIGSFIRIGGDLKLLRLFNSNQDENPDSFFEMESKLYVDAELIKQFNVVYEHDFRNGFGQYYGLVKDLPLNSSFMFGRFVTPYGLKLDDHTALIREHLIDNNAMDEGVMISVNPGRPFLNLSYSNGQPGARGMDEDKFKALSGNIGYSHEWFTIAGSYYSNKTADAEVHLNGIYGTTHYWNLSYLGEYDVIKTEGANNGHAIMQQLNYFPMRSLNFKFQYDEYQSDNSIDSTKDHRYSFGFQTYPLPFTELACQYRIEKEEGSSDRQVVLYLHGAF